jgi:hypothetical protein
MDCSPLHLAATLDHDVDRAASPSSGIRRNWNVAGMVLRNPTHGRQGKSAAFGRAHMVGRLEFCGPSGVRAGWRFNRKPQRIQRSDRRRRLNTIAMR